MNPNEAELNHLMSNLQVEGVDPHLRVKSLQDYQCLKELAQHNPAIANDPLREVRLTNALMFALNVPA